MSALNGVLFQFFHYHLHPAGSHWQFLRDEAVTLAAAGVTAVWLPPPCKGSGGRMDVGYGAYDLFDLGEFPQKGTVPTKYGNRAELEEAVAAVRQAGMEAYVDVVFNHKNGGDHTERLHGCEVNWDNRNEVYGCRDIEVWSHFRFPGRRGPDGVPPYSTMIWHWWHFDAADWDESRREKKLYRLKDKQFETEVSKEKGNYDYLLGVDLDTSHPEVAGELRWWGRWIVDTLSADGFRLDAVKHIRSSFFRDWINHLRVHFSGRSLFAVGEYWIDDANQLTNYLDQSEGVMSLFDVPLHYNLHRASTAGSHFDLRRVFDGSLVQRRPLHAVTFVDNHDTQPGEQLESWVEPWFKPHAYALILLRADGYPCLFYGDYYGDQYLRPDGMHATLHSHRFLIDRFLAARRTHSYGTQHDYFDHPNTIGWVRLGDHQHPKTMAVVMTNGSAGHKWMCTFRANARYQDATGHHPEDVVIVTNQDGWARFPCPDGKVSVWLEI